MDTYTGDGRRATGDGRRATGDGRRATGDGQKTVLLAARSAVALYRLLDAAPAFSGDARITRLFTLVPGSDFTVDTLAAIEELGGRLVPWSEARLGAYDLVIAASPKGAVRRLRGTHVLLPHGAGFNKSIPTEGSADSASGLDPVHLRQDDAAGPVALHAVAHPEQVARIAALEPCAARTAKVIGDTMLERVLASRTHRERYRAALGTGHRKLLVLTSTWGPEALLSRRPDLPAQLAAHLPYDEYQLALIVHPNERSRLGTYDLTERLAPAIDAGMVLAGPREEWASLLVAADALVTDHGSTALYYAAATDDRPVVGLNGETTELIPDTAMDVLLRQIPELGRAEELAEALEAYRPGAGPTAARAAFTYQGSALSRLREELYALIDLAPPARAVAPRLLPSPEPALRVPTAFDVRVEIAENGIRVERRAAGTGPAGHHLAVEHGAASERLARSAGLLYRRALASADAAGLAWSSGGWTAHALSEYPGCRSAASIPPSGACLLRVRGRPRPYAVQIEPRHEAGRIARVDPAAALSAVHAWLLADVVQLSAQAQQAEFSCLVGERAFRVRVRPATAEDGAQAF